MNPSMQLQTHHRGVTISAFRASKGTFVRVDQQMNTEFVLPGEALVACLAFEWLCSSVRQLVPRQVTRMCENKIALIACKRALYATAVSTTTVNSELNSGLKLLVALPTFVVLSGF